LPFANSNEERQYWKEEQLKRKMHLMDLSQTVGEKLLFQCKFAEAIPAAMQSLHTAVDLYGLSSIELVPSYLILGRASIGLDKLEQAEEYLLQAQWTALKNIGNSNKMKHRICHHFGLLYAAKGLTNEALRHLANDIYYASEEYGTSDIHTSGGYFHMGNIYYSQGDIATASSLFEQVTEIWHHYLQNIIESRLNTQFMASAFGSDVLLTNTKVLNKLDEAQQAEAVQVLTVIFNLWEQHKHIYQKPGCLAKIAHTLAMLYFIVDEIEKAKEFSRKAIGSSEAIQDEAFMRSLVEFLKMCENATYSMKRAPFTQITANS